jgi:2-polyprenyl-6-methoxyphenol hydroxylase-like FAD-dependent oxidoreductase
VTVSESAEVPYLIVGAGPVGLTAARLLSNAGKKCMVVERRDGPQRNPAAHVVNSRTLEILRQAGFDMRRISAIAQNPVDAGHVNFVTRLNGQLIGQLPFERQ